MENLDKLIVELCKQADENEWLEFKCNNYDPEVIGKDISALANSACYCDRDQAYMVWGVENQSHEIVGTNINKFSKLIGNQELESWLRTHLSRNAGFEFDSVIINEVTVVVLIIEKAKTLPVTFNTDSYIRVGSYTKRLNEYPGMEARLWDKLRAEKFEDQIALSGLTSDDVSNLLNIPSYFDLQKKAFPSGIDAALHYLFEDKIIVQKDDGLYSITNLGAILFAKQLSDFSSLKRKALRIISYEDDSKFSIKKNYEATRGYASGFDEMMQFLDAILPSEERITNTKRESIKAFPPIALREFIANALIHQDYSLKGTGPLVEVFPGRIEITNPGRPVIDINRFVDNPPRSRNEAIASLMRRFGFCEEAGSGWDRALIECEMYQLPAPQVEVYEENTKVTVFSSVPFSNLKTRDRIWSCYMHACIRYVVKHEGITNSSLRMRFGLNDTMSAQISRLLKKCVEEKYIKPFDPEADTRHQRYVPYWA